MTSIEFLESFAGRKYQYWKRYKKNTFFFSTEVTRFQTKKSQSIDENIRFQRSLLSDMVSSKRRCFRGNVAVEFWYNVNQKNSPAVQSLLKHYIDLIQKPLNGKVFRRKYILIKNDSQIKALSVFFWKAYKSEKQKLSIMVRPFRDFVYNLQFAEDIETGKFGDRDRSILTEDEEYEGKSRLLDGSHYQMLEGLADLTLEIDGKEIKYSELYKQMQEEERNRLSLKIHSDSLVNSFLSLIIDQEKYIDFFWGQTLRRIGRVTALKGLYTINFGHVPVSDGESKLFKQRIRQEIINWKENSGKYLPNNPAIALKIFYEKPSKVTHDLDNLLKYVLPHFDELINKDRYFKEVNSIEIYQIHTISENEEAGNLYLKIEEMGHKNLFHITQRLLERHENNGL